MSTAYLINPKPKESPDFERSFANGAAVTGMKCCVAYSEDFSFYFDKEKSVMDTYLNGTALDLDQDDFFFIRSWRTRQMATAILALALAKAGMRQTDVAANTSHDIRNSKITQIIQTYGTIVCFPNTWLGTKKSLTASREAIQKTFPGTVVLKTRGGTGDNVWLHQTVEEALQHISELDEKSSTSFQGYLIQEPVENRSDIRVVVLYGEIVTAIQRSAKDGFYNNVSKGAHAASVEITDEEVSIAREAARIAKLDLAGVDIVRTPDGPLIFEVNKAPDITAFNEAAGIDLAADIAEKVLARR